MKSILFTLIIVLGFAVQGLGQRNQNFTIFGESFTAKQITGINKFNDLGVKYYTSIINDFTDDEATYLWRLGSVRINPRNYTEGTYTLFDLSHSGSKSGYPVLDQIDFEFYEVWGFSILEARYPDIVTENDYQKFKDHITNKNMDVSVRREYLITYPDKELKNKLIGTKYLENRQPISSEVLNKIVKKVYADIRLEAKGLERIGIDSAKLESLNDYVGALTETINLRGEFISSRYDYRYIDIIDDRLKRTDKSTLTDNTDKFSRALIRYMQSKKHTINTAIFAIKFDGNYNSVKIDTLKLKSELNLDLNVKQIGDLTSYIKGEIDKQYSRTFSNQFSKVWIIGFGTDGVIDKLRLKK